MSRIILANPQALAEVRTHYFDYTPDLPSGVTVTSGAATHTPPSGSASTPTVGAAANDILPVTLGPLTVTGTHYLTCLATLSSGDKSEIKIAIPVIV